MNFLFNIVVWGDLYTELFLELSLKAQLAPGNLPEFVRKNQGHCRYLIYTTGTDAEKIRASQAFQTLCGIIDTEIVLLETLDSYGQDIRKTPVLCNAHAMHKGQREGYNLIFLVPDMIFADGSLSALLEIARTGKRVVMMGYFRTLWESFVPLFRKTYGTDGSSISASARELIKLAMDHLHPETLSWTWGSPNFRRDEPVFLYTTVPGKGMIERSFHLHPVMICPDQNTPLPSIEGNWSIDGSSYLSEAFPDFSQYYVVQDSDQLFALDLLRFDERYKDYIKPGRFNYLELLLWPTRRCCASHFFNYRHKIYFHVEDLDQSWREADAISDTVAASLEAMLELSRRHPEVYKDLSITYDELEVALREKAALKSAAVHAPAPAQAGGHQEEVDVQQQQLWIREQTVVLDALARKAAKPGCVFLEIGSWCGDSAIILGKVAREQGGKVYCIDWWKGSIGTELEGIAAKTDVFTFFWNRMCDEGLEDTIIPIRARSDEVGSFLKEEMFDLVFIDGDHRYDGIRNDIATYGRLVKSDGGILCGHDCEGRIGDFDRDALEEGKQKDYHANAHCGVVLAVGESFQEYNIDYTIWSVQSTPDPQKWRATGLSYPVSMHRKIEVILLPPTHQNRQDNAADRHLPFGIACLAGYFKDHLHINLAVPYAPYFNGTAEQLLAGSPATVISTGGMVVHLDFFVEYFKAAQRLQPQAARVLGGPVVTALPKEMLFDLMPIDAAVVGEGEETFEELILAIANGTPLSEVKSILYRSASGEIVATPARSYMNLLSKDPTPDWFSFFDLKSYTYAGQRQVPISAGRGCPNQCHFCGSPLGRYRYRRPQNVIRELKSLLKRYDLERFYFNDETFGSNKKQTAELCDALISEGLTKIPWSCFLRANLVDAALLAKMKQAGCDQVVIGVESGSQATLKRMKKNITVDHCREAVGKVREAGLRPLIAIMVGYLDESREDITATIDLMLELNELPEFITHTVAVPGTQLYDECCAQGRITDHLQHIKTMNQGIYFEEPPLLNLTRIPEGEYYPFLLDEKRRLHSTLYARNLARIHSHEERAGISTYLLQCPGCKAQYTLQIGAAAVWHDQICPGCNRHFWVDTLTRQRPLLESFLERCRARGRRLALFSCFDGDHLDRLFTLDPTGSVWELADTVITTRGHFYDRKVVSPDRYLLDPGHDILVLDAGNNKEIRRYLADIGADAQRLFFLFDDGLAEKAAPPQISIVIPSLRPESLRLCLESIRRYCGEVDYEIVVVSPFTPAPFPRMRHVPEESPIGNARATELGFAHARGSYVLTIADDMLLRPGSLKNLIAFMQQHDGELFLASLRGYDSEHIWTHWGFYGKPLAYCPCIARDKVALVGGAFFDPTLKNFFGDHDLSLRVWHAGGVVEVCPDAWFESISIVDQVKQANTADSMHADKELFFSRWEPRYGALLGNSREVADHFHFSGQTVAPLPVLAPPDGYWEIKRFVEAGNWDGLRSAMYGEAIPRAISEHGKLNLEKMLHDPACGIPRDIALYLNKFSSLWWDN